MGKKVAVIGGIGRMGTWLSIFFKDNGYDVFITGRNIEKTLNIAKKIGVSPSPSNIEAVVDADIVAIATSMESIENVILEISSYLKPGSIIFDIASLKFEVVETFKKLSLPKSVDILSIHPLFGPGTKSLKGKNIIIINIASTPFSIKKISELFEENGLKVQIIEDWEVHDKMMAITISLPFFLNFFFGLALGNIDVEVLKKYGGTTFKMQLLLTESIFNQDPELYYEICRNKFFIELLDNLYDIVKEQAYIIRRNNKEEFLKKFNETKYQLSKDPEFADAYEKFYKILETIFNH